MSQNTFVYCLNNPLCYSDSTGEFPWLLICVIAAVVAVGIDHCLAANQPDGGYAVVNNPNKNGGHEKVLFAEGGGFQPDLTDFSLCDLEAGVYSFDAEGEYGTLELFDFITASISVNGCFSKGISIKAEASASVYSPGAEFILPLGDFDIKISGKALIGAVGIGGSIDTSELEWCITPPTVGFGYSIGVDIDLRH